MRRLVILCTLGSLLVPCGRAAAQSLQRNSVQLSATALVEDGEDRFFIPGAELQFRRTLSALSLGAGIQFFVNPREHCSVAECVKGESTAIGFFEPRLVVGVFAQDRMAAYLAGRIARAIDSYGGYSLFGAGGGLMISVGSRSNLDLGLQGYTVGDGYYVYQTRIGMAVGF